MKLIKVGFGLGLAQWTTHHSKLYQHLCAVSQSSQTPTMGRLADIIRYTCQWSFLLSGRLQLFSSIRGASEMSNCIYRKRDSNNFNIFMTSNNLWDVPIENYNCTWYGPSLNSKFDRALINQSGCSDSHWRLKGVGRKQSGHLCLVLYSSDLIDWGPKPSRPFNVWLHNPLVLWLIQETLLNCSQNSWGLQGKLKPSEKGNSRLE